MTPSEILQELLTEASRHPGMSSPYINPKIIDFLREHFPSNEMLKNPDLLEKKISDLPTERGFRKISDVVDLLGLSPTDKEKLYGRRGESKDVVLRGAQGQPLVYGDGEIAPGVTHGNLRTTGLAGETGAAFLNGSPEYRLQYLRDHPEIQGVDRGSLQEIFLPSKHIPDVEERARRKFNEERKIEEDASKFARDKLGYRPGEAQIIPPSRGSIREDVHENLHKLKREINRAGLTSGQLSRREPSQNPELHQRVEKFIQTHNLPLNLEGLGSDRPAPVFADRFPVRTTAEGYPVDNQESVRAAARYPENPSYIPQGASDKSIEPPKDFTPFEDMDVQVNPIPKDQRQAGHRAAKMLWDISHEPYIPYKSPDGNTERLAPPSAEQDLAREKIAKIAKENPLAPHYANARKMLQEVAGTDLSKRFEEERKKGSSPITEADIRRHYDPYQRNVINAFTDEALEDFTNKIMRPLEGHLIGSGQFHTGARGRAMQEARRDLQRVGSREIARLQSTGFEKARDAALAEKRMAMEGMTRGADLAERDTQNRLEAASRIQRGAQEENSDELKNILTASHLGGQSQAHAQEKINMQIADFNAQKQDPITKAAQLGAVARGMPVPTAVMASQPQIQQAPMVPNTMQQLAGHAFTTSGLMLDPQRKSHGGRVHRSPGGSLISQALKDIRDQSLQESLTRSQELDKPGHNPWRDFLIHTGLGMSGSQNPRPLAALSEGMARGVDAFDKREAHNEERRNQAVNIRKAIADSLRAEEALAHERTRSEADDLYKAAKTKHLNWEMEGGKNGSSTGDQNASKIKELIQSGAAKNVREALEMIPSVKSTADERKELIKIHHSAGREGAPKIQRMLKDEANYIKESAPLQGPIKGRIPDALISGFASLIGSDTIKKQLYARQGLEKTSGNIIREKEKLAAKTNIPLQYLAQRGAAESSKVPELNKDIAHEDLQTFNDIAEADTIKSKYAQKLGLETVSRYVDEYLAAKYDPEMPFEGTFEDFMGWNSPKARRSPDASKEFSGSVANDNPALRAAQIAKARGIKVNI